jgi:hypothetical protein
VRAATVVAGLLVVLAGCGTIPVAAPPAAPPSPTVFPVPPDDPPGAATITTAPALFPAFKTSVPDYVVRCAGQPVTVSVDAPAGTTVSVAGGPASSGQFDTSVTRAVGQRFTLVVDTNGTVTSHNVRCLPGDFPAWSAQHTGTTAAEFYVTEAIAGAGVLNYPVVFDTNGVPVWWGPKATLNYAFPIGSTIAWNTSGGFQQHALDGSLLDTYDTVGNTHDPHDIIFLDNGDYVVVTATPKSGVDLSSWGGPSSATIVDHIVQEVRPDRTVAWSWRASDHISVDETTAGFRASEIARGGPTYDPFHWNSIERDGDGFVLSFRHDDAVYRIDQATGAIDWKLGGTTTPQSLTVAGDPEFAPNGGGGFGGQHDARIAADGTLSLYDDGTNRARPARGVVYTLDLTNRTATLVRAVADPSETAVACCGSFRPLPNGNYVFGWGSNPTKAPDVSEETRFGVRVFSLNFTQSGSFVYRAIPLLPGQITRAQFVAGMDAQFGG